MSSSPESPSSIRVDPSVETAVQVELIRCGWTHAAKTTMAAHRAGEVRAAILQYEVQLLQHKIDHLVEVLDALRSLDCSHDV